MNKQDIDAMMTELPSQRPPETRGQKILIATMFVLFLVGFAYAPDIINQPKEIPHGNCQKDPS